MCTRRLPGVPDGRFRRKGCANLPSSLRSGLDFGTQIHGDREMHPITTFRPGVMQRVSVEQMQHREMCKAHT